MLDTKRSAASKWLLYTVVTLGFVAVITPFVWMILGSFKPQGELLRVPPTWWPESPTLDNYRSLFSKQCSAWRLPEHWCTAPACCWPMNPPATSTRPPPPK